MRRHRTPLGRPGRLGLWTVFRFNPHVLVLLATVLALFYVAREAIPSFIFWRYGPTYRQVDFVMDRAQENDGSPIVRGPIEPGGEEWVLELKKAAAGYVLAGDPTVAFAPGRRVRVWWSDAAPVVGYGEGRSTKIMPVSTFPRIPGVGHRSRGAVAGGPARVQAERPRDRDALRPGAPEEGDVTGGPGGAVRRPRPTGATSEDVVALAELELVGRFLELARPDQAARREHTLERREPGLVVLEFTPSGLGGRNGRDEGLPELFPGDDPFLGQRHRHAEDAPLPGRVEDELTVLTGHARGPEAPEPLVKPSIRVGSVGFLGVDPAVR